jgi:hypothetical protein
VSTSFLGIEGRSVEEWNRYVGNLRSNFIRLREEEEDTCGLVKECSEWVVYKKAWV